MTPAHDGWVKVGVIVVCLVVLAVTVAPCSSAPWLSPALLRHFYIGATVGLLAWKVARRRWGVMVFGAVMCATEGARAVALAFDSLWESAVVHALLVVFAYDFASSCRSAHGYC